MALDKGAIEAMVTDWYVALDRHVELAEALKYLVDDGLEMVFPEVTSRGHDGFAEWYKAVTNRFFDEVHTVRSVDVTNLTSNRADVKVLVNWQAKIWNPPAAKSEWLGFDAYQTWVVVSGPSGEVKIQKYVVDRLEPMPGSATL